VKKCSKCGVEQHKEEFGKDALHKDGLRSACKRCNAIATSAWRERNPEKAKAQIAAWRASNKAKVLAYARSYYKANSEVYKLKSVAYRATNAESRNASRIAWGVANKEQIKKKTAEYRAENAAKCRSATVAWRAENKEKVRKYNAAWSAANPESARIHLHNRRARKRGSGGKLSSGLSVKLFNLQRGKCACCKQPLGDNYHLDHIFPLALGGANEDSNMQLLRKVCNLQKHAKHPVEFMQQRGSLL